MKALEMILQYMNDDECFVTMCVDLPKAFDRVNRKTLCKKLEAHV